MYINFLMRYATSNFHVRVIEWIDFRKQIWYFGDNRTPILVVVPFGGHYLSKYLPKERPLQTINALSGQVTLYYFLPFRRISKMFRSRSCTVSASCFQGGLNKI